MGVISFCVGVVVTILYMKFYFKKNGSGNCTICLDCPYKNRKIDNYDEFSSSDN